MKINSRINIFLCILESVKPDDFDAFNYLIENAVQNNPVLIKINKGDYMLHLFEISGFNAVKINPTPQSLSRQRRTKPAFGQEVLISKDINYY